MVYYLVSIDCPNGSTRTYYNLSMENVISVVKANIKDLHHIDPSLYTLNKQTVYNIIKNRSVNKIIKNLVKIKKQTGDDFVSFN